MKVLMASVLVLMVGCSTFDRVPPTPFPEPGTGQQVMLTNCKDLHKDVELWNKQHPNDQRIADC